MENMMTTEQKNAVKKHENTPNQSPQKMGARKRIYVLDVFNARASEELV